MGGERMMLVLMLLISGLQCGDAASSEAGQSSEETILRNIEDSLEMIDAHLRRLLDVLVPATTSPKPVTIVLRITLSNDSQPEDSLLPSTNQSENPTLNTSGSTIQPAVILDDSFSIESFTEGITEAFDKLASYTSTDYPTTPFSSNDLESSVDNSTDDLEDSNTFSYPDAFNESISDDYSDLYSSNSTDSNFSTPVDLTDYISTSAELFNNSSVSNTTAFLGNLSIDDHSHMEAMKLEMVTKDENTSENSSLHDPTDNQDLYFRLMEIMEGVENVTRQVMDDQATVDMAKDVESYASELKRLVDEVEKEPTFVEELKEDDFIVQVTELQQHLGDAEKVLEERLVNLYKSSPNLVIILAAVGGALLVAMVIISVIAIHKKRKLMGELENIRATNIPVQSFKESMAHENPGFQLELLRASYATEGATMTTIPRPRSNIETFGPQGRRSSFEYRPSSDPRGGGGLVGSYSRTPNPEYNIPRPLGETQNFLSASGTQLTSRVDDEEVNDPYSLEGRGHNVRRIHSGRLMRIDL